MRNLKFLFITLFLGGSLLCGIASFVVHNRVVDFSALAQYNPNKASRVMDDEGNELCRFELDRREFVSLSTIPKHVQYAFIAAEDHDFFNHAGISFRSMVRSFVVNMYHRRIVQGASTITQQLVKLLFFDSKKTFSRKIKEQLFAILIEIQFSKEYILETYLNHICFGCGIYGIEAAAQRFWGIHADQLSVAQGATLAAIVNYPARYCPLTHGETSLKRRDIILGVMVQLGFIDQSVYTKAKNEPVSVITLHNGVQVVYIKESIRQFLEERFGRHVLYTAGLTIQTTINQTMQHNAEQSFKQHVAMLRKELGMLDGALLTLEGSSGAIKALVGGYNFKQSQWNRALQAKRQMGSVFKPIVYAAAVAQGRSFNNTELDEPAEFGSGTYAWRPQNNNRIFEGSMTLARALSYSNNIIAIKTLLRCGADTVTTLARKMHIMGDISASPSLALGCVDVTVKEAAAVFNVFAHDGVYVEPYMVAWVKDEWGSTIYRHKNEPERVLESRVVGQVAKVLSIGIKRYLERLHITDFTPQAICKTGTTNDSRTCWFAGATPQYTTVIYVGRDNNESLGQGVAPVWAAFPIWLSLYRTMHHAETVFRYDPSLRELCINWITGQPAAIADPESVSIYV